MELKFVKTTDQLPPKEYWDVELLGRGNGVSGHVGGQYSIMRYDGDWWNEDGTEMHEKGPTEWCLLPLYRE